MSERDVGNYLAAANLAVFPFTAVANSGSILLALGAGLPIVVPDIPEFADLPNGATIRFVNTDAGLAEALDQVEQLSSSQLEEMAGCAAQFARDADLASRCNDCPRGLRRGAMRDEGAFALDERS